MYHRFGMVVVLLRLGPIIVNNPAVRKMLLTSKGVKSDLIVFYQGICDVSQIKRLICLFRPSKSATSFSFPDSLAWTARPDKSSKEELSRCQFIYNGFYVPKRDPRTIIERNVIEWMIIESLTLGLLSKPIKIWIFIEFAFYRKLGLDPLSLL